MGKLSVSYEKTLKLNNACFREIADGELEMMDKIIFDMENYIKSKGAKPIGPLIQRMYVKDDMNGPEVGTQIIIQTNIFINKLESPYWMESIHRCRNCLFVRFYGHEENLKYAYDKLNLVSFEEDIALTGTSYTVFTSQKEDEFSADVFMEKKQ